MDGRVVVNTRTFAEGLGTFALVIPSVAREADVKDVGFETADVA